jgi:hypothetical protein
MLIFGFIYNGITIIDIVNVADNCLFRTFDSKLLIKNNVYILQYWRKYKQ